MSIIDPRGRLIDYARISLTDRCNYRCVYCMPEEGVARLSHGGIMRYEEIIWLARVLVSLGVRHIRFTGGEPLVRKGMPEFLLSFRKEFPDIRLSLTTNASLLGEAAPVIARARLSGINVSLDTVDPVKFSAVTRTGDIRDVFGGIEAAASSGISPIKTNTVLMRGFNDAELPEILNFAWSLGLIPRIIEFMPLNESLWARDSFIGSDEIKSILNSLGDWKPEKTDSQYPRGPAKYFADRATGRRVGIIEAVSNHFCESCNRLRITASGKFRACLFNNREIPLLGMVRARDRDALTRAITEGIGLKPAKWTQASDGDGNMSGIGG
ncbi:MAG: GTP 3',8-cyclase MoaA [Synergistaceae bacterium]|jgi:cyclic pyranopterin phosphate synthase|nr:GTP 3',8-cyclase MoaA [Synergistaceae bacterium]